MESVIPSSTHSACPISMITWTNGRALFTSVSDCVIEVEAHLSISGGLSCIRLFGPAFGFGLSAWCLSLYENPFGKSPCMSHPRDKVCFSKAKLRFDRSSMGWSVVVGLHHHRNAHLHQLASAVDVSDADSTKEESARNTRGREESHCQARRQSGYLAFGHQQDAHVRHTLTRVGVHRLWRLLHHTIKVTAGDRNGVLTSCPI